MAESPQAVSEHYYQIAQPVLDSFPKYRLPLDLFELNEKVYSLVPFYKKETRLSNEKIERMHELCASGNLFVARSDFPIYSEHIVKQLDLVLIDPNFKESEIADLIVKAFQLKLADFFEQPVRVVFDRLREDIMVFTEYLWNDRHHIRNFMRRLHTGDYSLVHHSINSLFVGMWLLLREKGDELTRKEMDNYAIGLLLHDVGMTKVPAFITGKTTPLKPEEKEKIPPHAMLSSQIIIKMELVSDDIKAICTQHHERYNGTGYPQKLKSSDITKAGAISAIADSFSAMIQKRPYAEAKTTLDAAKELMLDTVRYDKHLSTIFYTALFTKEL